MKFILLVSVLLTLAMSTQAEISIQNSDRKQAILSIAPQSSYLSYNFGRVGVNTMNTTTYTVSNRGTTFLQFAGANIWGSQFDSNHSCFGGLQPNQRCQFQIRYWPYILGLHSSQFEIRFYGSTPAQEIINVQLWGEAVQR